MDSSRVDDTWTVQGLMTHGQCKNNLTSLQGTLGQLDFTLGTLGQLDFTQGTRGQLYTRGYWDNFTLGDAGATRLHSGGHWDNLTLHKGTREQLNFTEGDTGRT